MGINSPSISFRGLAGALIVALAALAPRAVARGCEGHSFVRAVVDPLPPALDGVRVSVFKTAAQQLVIESSSARIVEVLDDHGVPFIRIGPAGVEGNITVPAWYRALSPGAVVPASSQTSEVMHWRQVNARPVFGWFDPRLDSAAVRLSPETMMRGAAVEVGRWAIPLRVDGRAVTLSGRFRYEPPAGTLESRLTSPRTIAPGVDVTLLPGQRPGLMLHNTSGKPVVVFGQDGEPFLRIGPDGVSANVHSPTWWRSARSTSQSAPVLDAASPPRWIKVAVAPRFSWIEPRAAQGVSAAGNAPTDMAWRVPLRIGTDTAEVTGTAYWRAF